jgi:hypothetical protein
MAKRQRLIDANALIADYDRVHIGPPGGARKLMEEAPTVDAVPVVRCKDCIYSQKHQFTKGIYLCDHPRFKWAVPRTSPCMDARDFCSCGERREENG